MGCGQITFKQIEGIKDIELIFQTGIITKNSSYAYANNVIAVDINGKEFIITDRIIPKISENNN